MQQQLMQHQIHQLQQLQQQHLNLQHQQQHPQLQQLGRQMFEQLGAGVMPRSNHLAPYSASLPLPPQQEQWQMPAPIQTEMGAVTCPACATTLQVPVNTASYVCPAPTCGMKLKINWDHMPQQQKPQLKPQPPTQPPKPKMPSTSMPDIETWAIGKHDKTVEKFFVVPHAVESLRYMEPKQEVVTVAEGFHGGQEVSLNFGYGTVQQSIIPLGLRPEREPWRARGAVAREGGEGARA